MWQCPWTGSLDSHINGFPGLASTRQAGFHLITIESHHIATRSCNGAITLQSSPNVSHHGAHLERYEIIGPLGAGGMGEVIARPVPEKLFLAPRLRWPVRNVHSSCGCGHAEGPAIRLVECDARLSIWPSSFHARVKVVRVRATPALHAPKLPRTTARSPPGSQGIDSPGGSPWK
jgi:hypothetical protein